MQHLRGHVDVFIRIIQVFPFLIDFGRTMPSWGTLARHLGAVEFQIMGRVDEIEGLPRMKHFALLRVVFAKHFIQGNIEAPFIAIIPENHARMVYVARDERLHQLAANFRVVMPMPAREFV